MIRTNNITRHLRKTARRFNLEVDRTEVQGDMVTYLFRRNHGDIRDFNSIEYVVDISKYKNEYATMLGEKAQYDIGKSEVEFEKKMKRVRLLNEIKRINELGDSQQMLAFEATSTD